MCTLCPAQCNVTYTVRDEQVMRVLARDNAGVIGLQYAGGVVKFRKLQIRPL